jgi:hypothetical protein
MDKKMIHLEPVEHFALNIKTANIGVLDKNYNKYL